MFSKLPIFTVIISILCIPFFAQSQINLSGKVYDAASKNALTNISVTIFNQNKNIQTNENGFYTISIDKPQLLNIQYNHPNFGTEIKSFYLQKDTVIDVYLKHSVIEEEPTVTVTSYANLIRTKQFPQPIDIVTQKKYLGISAPNAIDALAKLVPGFATVSSGPAVAKPFIRGLGYNRVVTVIDNIKQEGQQWGDEHGIEIDDYSLQKIEVIKGPASLMYGSDALAGVINIQTLPNVRNNSIKGNFLSEYQTNSSLRGFHGNIAGNKNGFLFNAFASYKAAQDYTNKYDGRVFNSKFSTQNFGGMLGYESHWGYSKLLVSHFQLTPGMIEGERDETSGKFLKALPNGEETIADENDFKRIKPFVPYQKVNHLKISSLNRFNLKNSYAEANIAYQKNDRKEFGNAAQYSIPDAQFDLQTFNYNILYHLPEGAHWKMSFGTNGMYQQNKNLAEEMIIPDYDLFDIGAFTYLQYFWDKFNFSGGLRYDVRSINSKEGADDHGHEKFSSFKKNLQNFSGSIGATYEISKIVSVKLNAASGFRAPNLAELASNGAHEGTLRYEIGDQSLSSERSYQIDAGISVSSDHIHLQANTFYNKINNFIFYQRVTNAKGTDSLMYDEHSNETLQVFQFNQHNVQMHGFEFNMDLHPHPLDWLHFENTFSYTRAKFTNPIDGSENVPFIPAARWIALLRANLLQTNKTFGNLQVSLEHDYNFAQKNAFTGYNTETATAAYSLLNAAISFDVNKKNKNLFTVYFSANNLLDIAYQNHFSRLKYLAVNDATGRKGVFAPGRNFSFKINIPVKYSWY